eukprot:GEMP01081175.1.p1 GENE.GEMP01081175.1~~GEMP01081175.1.p1  ORF type:complete len:192 (+),score=27.57 GEMP01081175.1:165-740(+)
MVDKILQEYSWIMLYCRLTRSLLNSPMGAPCKKCPARSYSWVMGCEMMLVVLMLLFSLQLWVPTVRSIPDIACVDWRLAHDVFLACFGLLAFAKFYFLFAVAAEKLFPNSVVMPSSPVVQPLLVSTLIIGLTLDCLGALLRLSAKRDSLGICRPAFGIWLALWIVDGVTILVAVLVCVKFSYTNRRPLTTT